MNVMNVLSVLGSCDDYLDMILETKKIADLQNAIVCMKSNKDLENALKRKMTTEEDFDIVLFLINNLWYEFKKNHVKDLRLSMSSSARYETSECLWEYQLKLLLEIFEILSFQNEYTKKIIRHNSHFRNIIISSLIRGITCFGIGKAKERHEGNSNSNSNILMVNNTSCSGSSIFYFSLLDQFISTYRNEVNLIYVLESLRNEGLISPAIDIANKYSLTKYSDLLLSSYETYGNNKINNISACSSASSVQNKQISFSSYTNPSSSFYIEMFSLFEKDTDRIKVPTHWKLSELSKYITLSEMGTMASYIIDDNSFYTVRANISIPNIIGVYYFEICILSMNNDVMGIGLINKEFNVQNKLPGWENNSLGYHSDDGNIFLSSTLGEHYGPKFGKEDYVGCCVNFIERVFFFTRNGEQLKVLSLDTEVEYFPAVGMRKQGQAIKGNFGDRDFYFDFRKYYNEKMDQYITAILSASSQVYQMPENYNYDLIILDYLRFNGFEETYNEMKKYLPRTMFFNDQNLKIRKQIAMLLENRKFDDIDGLIADKILFPNTEECKIILSFYKNVYTCYHCFKLTGTSHSLVLKFLKEKIIFNKTCAVLKRIPNFNFDTITQQLVECVAFDKKAAIKHMEKVINAELSSDIMFSQINQSLLMSNYSVCNNELETIIKQLILTLKENYNMKSPMLSFLMTNRFFFQKLNSSLIQNGVIFSDLHLRKTLKKYFDKDN